MMTEVTELFLMEKNQPLTEIQIHNNSTDGQSTKQFPPETESPEVHPFHDNR